MPEQRTVGDALWDAGAALNASERSGEGLGDQFRAFLDAYLATKDYSDEKKAGVSELISLALTQLTVQGPVADGSTHTLLYTLEGGEIRDYVESVAEQMGGKNAIPGDWLKDASSALIKLSQQDKAAWQRHVDKTVKPLTNDEIRSTRREAEAEVWGDKEPLAPSAEQKREVAKRTAAKRYEMQHGHPQPVEGLAPSGAAGGGAGGFRKAEEEWREFVRQKSTQERRNAAIDEHVAQQKLPPVSPTEYLGVANKQVTVPGEAGQSDTGYEPQFYATRDGEPVYPKYVEGNQYEPGYQGPEAIARWQRDLVRGGLLTEAFTYGVWDDATVKAYTALLSHANRTGLDNKAAVTHFQQARSQQKKAMRARAVQQGLPVDYDALEREIRQTFEQRLGRDPNASEMEWFREQMAYQYRATAVQEGAFNFGVTNDAEQTLAMGEGSPFPDMETVQNKALDAQSSALDDNFDRLYGAEERMVQRQKQEAQAEAAGGGLSGLLNSLRRVDR